MRVSALVVALVLLTAWASPVSAQTTGATATRSLSWGPRIGVADDPDQILVGIHFDLGFLEPDLRLQPSAELGLGDNRTVLSLTAPVHYRFRRQRGITPYAGGGLLVGLVEWDRPATDPPRDDTNLEIALSAIGGLEWRLRSGNAFLLELNLAFGDLQDVKVLAGWTFR